MTEYLWFLFSYLVGSIPNGYLIVKWVAGKDIRKIGREKLSGSNIIHNIGFLPGVVSGFFDIFKGILAVWGAYKLGFPENIQAIAGLFALCGQMWPIFLKFWGGRGGSVCIATILILSPKIFWPSALLWIFSKIFSKGMGAAIGMSLFCITSIVLGFYLSVESVVIFAIPAFILVLLQRLLGRPGSLSKIKDKKIILWRLLLDRDTKER
ncbi:MAG: hypothetical protein CO034_03125 [Parcubacteria group bacterium CG_4_9_14_0_2_um_filter_35_11]|nr:MAG: hypothetical protein COS98_01245 [Parcubacteria group bacterium CG07_land_8_20_14_0_80_35_11]PJC47277.1 MAG: hypothetical protein CO034_03125 [Parcubacteria group bacterium CG_4_9_14_0_2_um_filter_35_11]